MRFLPAFSAALVSFSVLGAPSLAPAAATSSVPARAIPSTPHSQPPLAEQQLTPRTHSPGTTMFVPLAPEATGVLTENKFDDPEMWGRRYREIEIGAIGTGLAIGDYDGDGRPDLFIVSKTESSRLFRNLGDFKFEDVSVRTGVADEGDAARIWKQGATFADVNNDGHLDLYLCRFNAPNRLYINQGDGTFKDEAAAYGLDLTDASVMAAFSDYDRDGWLDVFIQTNLLDGSTHPEGQRDHLYRNNRDGTFSDVTKTAGIAAGPTHGNSATWWDFDSDGWPDLYVANDFEAPDALYRNNRDGTFTDVIDHVVPRTPYSSMGSDLGDINNDGRIDFMASDMAATNHVADQRTMAESRARSRDPDENSTVAPQHPRNTLFLNTGLDRMIDVAQLAGLDATDWTWSVRWEDLDNDGRLDLHVTNGMHREIHNVDLISRRMSAENIPARVRIVRSAPVFAEAHLAFRNHGDLRFENVSAIWGLDEKAVSFGAAFGDLDGDGDLDLVYTNYQAGATVLRNDNDSGHRITIALRGTQSNRFGIGAKLRLESAAGLQARELTLARGYMASSEPIVHFGLGEDTVIQKLTLSWPSGHVQIFENLPVDRRFVITEPASPISPAFETPEPTRSPQFVETSELIGLSWTAREEAFDEFRAQRLLPVRLNRRGPPLAVGPLETNGQKDGVIVGGTTVDTRRVLRPAAGGKFTSVESPVFNLLPPVNDGPVLLFDAVGDGRMHLLVTRGGASQPEGSPEYQPQLFLNDGNGQFEAAPDGALPPLSISAGAAAAADFDRDGRLDVFIGGRVTPGDYPRSPRSALLANRGGKFDDVTERLAADLREVGMVTAALWSDVDQDGWPDLLLTLEWGEVKYFHNREGKSFEDWTERSGFASAGNGWWRSIAAGDFNRDGRTDYVVGNLGLNTPYRANAEHPVVLFSGDFTGRGTTEIIEGYYEDDQLYPRRSRRDLAAAIPTLLRRFPKNDTFAQATLPAIIGQDKLDAAVRIEATELRSGVFLSQPDGRYRFSALPRIAQIAPINGIVTGDFDGDGNTDILVAQNSHAPTPSLGRFDSGLGQFLRGDGHGRFIAASALESGLKATGAVNALVVLDFNDDGWPDILASRNNDTTLAYRNAGVTGHRSLRISLIGSAGNPTAIGARITAEFADGSKTSHEVSAGSGYSSQSTAAVFFGHSERNPVQRVHVQWPSASITTHDVSANSTAVTFSFTQID